VALDDREQPRQHLGFGEILLHLLFGEGVALLQQLFGRVRGIPGLEVGDRELIAGECPQLGDVLFGERPGLGCQFA